MSVLGPVSPLALERYELKYLISLDLIEPISQFIEAYCDLDYYSQVSEDYFYNINSLYLDSPSPSLMRSKESVSAFSFNMRVRSYESDPVPPYYYEIKYKIRDFVKKKRSKILSEDWAQIIQSRTLPDLKSGIIDQESIKNAEDFVFMSDTYNVEPVLLTQHRRKAYFSYSDDVRVTIDRDLRFQETKEWTLHGARWERFEKPENFILELKCRKEIPRWMMDLIRHFSLTSTSFSKYGNSMAALYQTPKVLVPGPLYR